MMHKQVEPMRYIAEGNAVVMKNSNGSEVRMLKKEEIGSIEVEGKK